MSYTLTLSNGKILLTLADQFTDRVSTSLAMIGKNVNSYGADLNDNFVHLLENFANTINNRPINPLIGQLWFNTTDQRLYVYSSSYTATNDFKPVGSPIISNVLPPTISTGDFWFDSSSQQLKFLSSPGNVVTVGPTYNSILGKAGLIVEDAITTIGTQTVLGLYIDGGILGIVSNSDVNFTTPYNGFTSATSGFSLIPGYKFIGTATSSDTLISPTTGEFLTADSFFRKDVYPVYTQGFVVANDFPGITIGSGTDIQIFNTGTSITTSNPVSTINIAGYGQDFNIQINPLTTSSIQSAFYVDSTNSRIGIFNTTPAYTLDINGSLNVAGNLFVTGSSTYITSSDLRVDDKRIELAYSTVTTDLFATNGGIILHGTTDKTLTWNGSELSGGTNAWTSNVNVNLSTYAITTNFVSTSTITPNLLVVSDTSQIVPDMTISGNGLSAGLKVVSVINSTQLMTNIQPYSSTSSSVLTFTYSPAYQIGGVPVIENGKISQSILASSLTSVGVLTDGTRIGQLVFSTSTIGTANVSSLVLGNASTQFIDANGNTIQNLTSPPINNDPQYNNYAVNKNYVDSVVQFQTGVQKGQFSTSIDVTGHATYVNDPEMDVYVISMLSMLYPTSDTDPSGYYGIKDGARARVMLTRYTTYGEGSVPSDYINFGNPVVVNSGTEVIAYSQYIRATTTIPTVTLGVNRAIKQYIVSGGSWLAYNIPGTNSNVVYTDGSW